METVGRSRDNAGRMISDGESHGCAVPILNCLKVHEGTVSHAVLDECFAFLESMRLAVTSRKRQVMGKTFLDPKKDTKWERGRTRQVLHFGAHVRGGKAVGAEVEDVPPCLVEVMSQLQAQGFLASSRKGEEAAQIEAEDRVVAVTVDFFRKGSYTPALAATTPFLGSVAPACLKPAQQKSCGEPSNMKRKSSRDATTAGDDSDAESEVCMLWLQNGGEVVVGSAAHLAKCIKGPKDTGAKGKPPSLGAEKPQEVDVADRRGVFYGTERIRAPKGSVMIWSSAPVVAGLQVAVPSSSRDGILVSFQTLTPEASMRVVDNRRCREEARAKSAMLRKIAKEAKEAKGKGPIPGTPVVVENWEEQDLEDGKVLPTKPDKSSSGCDNRRHSEDGKKTPSIEKEHVQAVYDTIAPHWSHTRYKPWPKVEKFLSELEACSLVADAGCGNGKYLGCDAAGGFLLGSDASVNLLQVCRERLPEAEVMASDCMRLPYRSGVFDAAISIAVLHHFSSEARRLRALSELCRLLKPRGRVLVYAWAIEQEQDSRRSFAAQDVLVPWHLADHHNPSQDSSTGDINVENVKSTRETCGSIDVMTNRGHGHPTTPAIPCNASAPAEKTKEEARAGDNSGNRARSVGERASAPVPSVPQHGVRVDTIAGTGGSVVYQRYCHVYAEGELEGLVERVDGLRLVESYYDRSNWCVVAEREI